MNLYIHVPFCTQRCSYCDFYTQTQLGLRDLYVEAVLREIELRRAEVSLLDPIRHIYFGGGTPSLLSLSELERIFDHIYRYYPVESGGEITLEANPDDMTIAYARALSSLPINRVSMGVQSLHEEDLKFLNRRHSVSQVYHAIDALRSNGIDAISLDLIYGLPGQTACTWRDNLERVCALSVPHISAYHLIYEEGTPLMRLRNLGKVQEISEEDSLHFLRILIDRLGKAGYEHYEISNFALPNHYAQLNTGYWQGVHYLGLGPAAHSYDGQKRSHNVASIRQYAEALALGQRACTDEPLSEVDKLNEYIMTRLRTMWGIDLVDMQRLFGGEEVGRLLRSAKTYLDRGLLRLDNDRICLTSEGIFVSDAILVDLFI